MLLAIDNDRVTSMLKLRACIVGTFLLAAVILLHSSPAFSDETLASVELATLKYTLVKTSYGYTLEVSALSPSLVPLPFFAANVFSLKDPSRLVVDIPIVNDVPKNPISLREYPLSVIRFGKHPRKTRFVLNIDDDLIVNHQVEKEFTKGTLKIDFDFPEHRKTADPVRKKQEIKTATLRRSSKSLAPLKKPRWKQAVPSEKSRAIFEKEQRTEAPSTPKSQWLAKTIRQRGRLGSGAHSDGSRSWLFAGGSMVVIQKHLPYSSVASEISGGSSQLLKEMKYQRTPDGSLSAIELHIDAPVRYSIRKIDSHHYRLTLYHTKKSDRDIQTECAPEHIEGFQVYVPRETQNHTAFDIYVDKGVRLEANRARYGLELRALRPH